MDVEAVGVQEQKLLMPEEGTCLDSPLAPSKNRRYQKVTRKFEPNPYHFSLLKMANDSLLFLISDTCRNLTGVSLGL